MVNTAATPVTECEPAPDLRLSWAGLLRVFEPPEAAVAAYVAAVGASTAWQQIKSRAAPTAVLAATSARTAGRTAADLDAEAEADLAVAATAGARVIGPGDPEWPEAAFIGFPMTDGRAGKGSAPPVALYVRGGVLSQLPERSVAIVGSRANTAYGQRIAGDIAIGAAEAGLTIVSGAAFGIDTVAHRSALLCSAALPTVAVLACGIDRAYPAANAALLDRIAATGAVVSEYPPGAVPARHRFLVRNRLIAALSTGTVVVEAGRRSGTLSTASATLALNRILMAVPGPVTSALSVGCHLLLAAGGTLLVTGADDVLAAVGGPGRPEAPELWPTAAHPTDGLAPEVARVYEALPFRAGRTVAQLSVESALLGREVMSALAELELHDLVRKQEGSWYRRRLSAGS